MALWDEGYVEVDAAAGLVHTVTGTAANEADITQTAALPHRREEAVSGDAGDNGVNTRPEPADRHVSCNTRSGAASSSRCRKRRGNRRTRSIRRWRRCAVVEHPFPIIKNRFGHKKLRYRGLQKNTALPCMLFALANLVIVKKALLVPTPHYRHSDAAIIREK